MSDAPRPVTLTDELREQLGAVSTATITSQLQRRGVQNCFLSGLRPLNEGQRMIGYAHTLRYVPARPDVGELMGFNAPRVAVESIQPEEVLIIEARGAPLGQPSLKHLPRLVRPTDSDQAPGQSGLK